MALWVLNSKKSELMKKPKSHSCKALYLGLILLLGFSISNGQNIPEKPTRIRFSHDGNQIKGWFYTAKGTGPFTSIILLQGSVGQDGDVLKLGQKLSGEGFNVMTYNYPGSWQSEGIRTDEVALSSVQSAIDFAKSEYAIHSFQSDTSDIILIGYSYGGGMALLGSVFDQTIRRVIAIAAGDLSILADKLEENPNARKHFQQMLDQVLSNPAMARGTSGQDYVESLFKNRDKYNLKRYSEELAKKELLLIGGWLDQRKKIEEELLPLYRALLAEGADHVEINAFETDHSFVHAEEELAQAIIGWLKKTE
jgi:pimeloyl-ACP methyl ester carboxylesterase